MKKKRGAAKPPQPAPQSPAPGSQADATPELQAPPPPEPAAGRIYTQCPLCKTVYRITVAQLRGGRGEALCQQCLAGFNVLDTLAETAARARQGPAPAGQVPPLGRLDAVAPPESALIGDSLPADDPTSGGHSPAQRPALAARLAWGAGTLLLLALLAAQLGWFEGPQLAQNETLRPWLEAACQTVGCRLPPFRAPARIQIVGHDLHPTADGYEFTLVLSNQASLPQPFPAVKLSLDAHGGNPAAVRVFQPEEYLPAAGSGAMAVGELQEIRLLLARPQQEIGGFSFELQ
jgi:predicted Zn finger-like uncharacterized protein